MSAGKDPEKARRAAADPRRPGEKCQALPGVWRPVVDVARCEGKGDCLEVCPYDVFELGRLSDEAFSKLGLLARLKSTVHGRKTVFTPKAADCRACGMCVVACPEKALKLEKVTAADAATR